ncbi:hypothetical protein EXE10_13785 [Acinetobacter sp. WCHAc060033]|uniref:hemagglutinin repeat-containing protein n=1 Tax=Acinetobacter sp. WCHAc060033 TaxID=2518624 RepID=UPI00102398F5|nr:hemagglutinin repeat-containing protein [Acinetobacter sp. WCHAc060033]RZG80853.1 hypothetical protein EXE10_13785 [Acinetobacter sp. WCHAc060033]
MNHIYKTVWNKSKNAFDVVSEAVSSKGKSTSGSKDGTGSTTSKLTAFFAVLTPIAAMLFVQQTVANVDVASGNTRVFNANNGVQVIDIATANAAGISHNRYVNYNVDKTGQILNNAVQTPKNLSVMTQLAGNIQTNKNLDKSARVILNEVTGTNRSQLSGHVEVAGNKADVVIANPYGITCNGCGFINTDRATLTTGTPQFNTDGSIKNYTIRQGDITVDGNGLNATGQNLLQLLSRNLNVKGQINAKQLEVVTGANEYDVTSGIATAIQGVGAVPTYAIDSSELGGIYANRISLIASDQGVGVKMLGNVAASGSDFTLSASGKIELNNKISAAQNLSVQNNNNVDNNLNINGSLTAKNIALGSVDNNHLNIATSNGSIYAENGLNINSNQLDMVNSVVQSASDAQINNATQTNLTNSKLNVNNTLNLNSNSLTTQGLSELSSIGGGLNITIEQNLSIGDAVSVIAQNNINLTSKNADVTVGKAKVKSEIGDLNISASNIGLNAESSAQSTNLNAKNTVQINHNAQVSSQKNISISANNVGVDGKIYSNDANINANNNATLNAGSVVSSINSNSIKAGQILSLVDKSNLTAGNTTDLNAANITLAGQIQAQTANINATNSLIATNSGLVFATNVANLNALNIDLAGKQLAQNLNITAIKNLNSTGMVSVSNIAQLNAENITVQGDITASNAVLQAKNSLSVQNGGSVGAANNVEAKANTINIVGSVKSNSTQLTADTDLLLDQNSAVESVENIQLNSSNLTVKGNVKAKQLSAQVQNQLNLDQGSDIQATELAQLNALNINANGQLTAKVAQLNAKVATNVGKTGSIATIQNTDIKADKINVDGNLTAQNLNADAKSTLNVNQTANITTASTAQLKANDLIVAGAINTQDAQLNANNSVNIAQTANIGTSNNLNITANDAVIMGKVKALNTTIQAANALNLEKNAQLQSANLAQLNAKDIMINGQLYTKQSKINAQNKVNLNQGAELVSSDGIDLNAAQANLNGLVNATNANLTATGVLTVDSNAQLSVINQANLNANDLIFNGKSNSKNLNLQVNNGLNINASSDIRAQETANINAQNIAVNSQILANNTNLTAIQQLDVNQAGTLLANNNLSLKAQNINISGTSQANTVDINASNNLNTAIDSLIISNNNLALGAGSNINLNGQTSAVTTNIKSTNDLTTGDNFVAISDDKATLESQSLSLAGKVYAKNADITTSNTLATLQNSQVNITETLSLLSKNSSIDLAGTTSAQNQNLTAVTTITTQQTALVNALNALIFKADSLIHGGALYNATGLTTTNINNLTNNGTLQSSSFALNGLKNFNNNKNFLSAENLNIVTEAFSNKLGSQLASNADLTLTVTKGALTNDGTIGSVGNLTLKATPVGSSITNNATLQANKTVSLNASNVLNNTNGVINAAENIAVTAQQIENKGNVASKNVVLNATGGTASTVKNSGIVFANKDISIDADDTILNTGTLYTKSATAGAVDDTMHLTAKNIKNLVATDGSGKYGVISTSWVPFTVDYLLNEGSIQALRAIINNKTLNVKTNFDNYALNGTNDSKGFYAFWNLDAQNLGTLNNTGTLSVHLENDPKDSATTVTADKFNNTAGASVYFGKYSNLTVNGQTNNQGTLYLEKGNATLQNLNNDNGILVLDGTNATLKSDFTNNGSLSLLNSSNLDLKQNNLTNSANKNIYLSDSSITTGNGIANMIGGIVKTIGNSNLESNTLVNNGLIHSLGGILNIQSNTLTNNYNSGIIGLGVVNINKKLFSSNVVNNYGNIYANKELNIGVGDSNDRSNSGKGYTNITNYTNNSTQKSGINKPTGGVISSDKNINIYANNFMNNFAIISNSGDITIDTQGKFINETNFYGESLRVDYYNWEAPKHLNDFDIRQSGDEKDSFYYDVNGNKLTSSTDANIRATTTRITAEHNPAVGNDHQGFSSSLVTEIWKQATVTKSGTDNVIANKYLASADPAKIIANNGNIILKIGDNGENYGGKIIALGDSKAGKGSVDITLKTGKKFTNRSIDLYDFSDDHNYELQYLLMIDKNSGGDVVRTAIAFKKDLSVAGSLPMDIGESWDSPTQYYNDRIKPLSSSNSTLFNTIYWWSDNFLTQLDGQGNVVYDNQGKTVYLLDAQSNKITPTLNTTADIVSKLVKNTYSSTALKPLPSGLSSNIDVAGSSVISGSGNVFIDGGVIENLGNNSIKQQGEDGSNIKGVGSTTAENCGVLGKDCKTNITAYTPSTYVKENRNAQSINNLNSTSLTSYQSTKPSTKDYSVNIIDGITYISAPEGFVINPSTVPELKEATKVNIAYYQPYPITKIPTVDLDIPTTKYSQYVATPDSHSKYLVESNPLYGANSDVLGSNYLTEQLGIDPDKLLKRLGDDGYEMNLVQKQLIQMTGTGVLFANASASDQMKILFDNATSSSKDLGLEYGKALTIEQLSKLDSDIVWMVEGTVSGQKVLIPQVYLSQKTVNGINTSGAVIDGKVGTILTVDSLTNQNGTIAGGIVYADVKKDINNIGGKIKGDDVILKSQEGSINNITKSYNFGNSASDSTTFGQTASIESNGTLILDAAKDINNIAATLKAKGDASIKAGNDINIKSLEDHTATTSSLKKGDKINEDTNSIGNGSINTNTTTHVGSTIDLGGNAAFESGGNTLISGSDVNVKGQMYAKTGGNFTLESVQDTKETKTSSSRSGFGVGGGIYGTQTQETTDFEGKNKASNLNVGSLIVDSDQKVVIAGSNVNIKDKDSFSLISGKQGVDILDGKDEERHEKTTTTTTFLKVTKGPSETSTSAKAGASAESHSDKNSKSASAGASAEATASVAASASGSASLRLMEHTVTKEVKGSDKSVSSNINSNGSLLISSEQGDVTVRGSSVDVKGALGVDAKNINILAGQNKDYSSKDTTQTSIGVYVDGKASAGANAEAKASADAKAGVSAMPVSANANANAGVSARAGAEGMATFGGLHETSSVSTTDITHNLSSLKSGGDMSLVAKDKALFQGANISAGQNLDIRGTDIVNKAVEDKHETTNSNSSHLAGYFIGAKGEVSGQAEAHANATTGKLSPSGSAGVTATGSVSAEMSQGLRTTNSQSTVTDTQTTHTGNSFSAGGNMTRVATNTIYDEATQVNVAGGFAQKATTIIDNAVQDRHTVTKDSQTHNATVAFTASATGTAGMVMEAKVGKESSTSNSTTASKNPNLSFGVSAKYEGTKDQSQDDSTVARTSSFNAGGDITSISTGNTTLTGTQFNSGGNVNLVADKLTFNAAADTTSKSAIGQKFGAGAGAEFDISGKLKSANLDGSYGNTTSHSQSSTAVVGGINAAGNVNVVTNQGASFEGTQLLSGGNTSISGKDVTFKAAQNTASSTTEAHKAGVALKVETSGGKADSGSGSLSYKGEKENSSSSQAVVSNILTGGSLTINADNASFEGTNLASLGNTNISANTLDFKAARDKSSSDTIGGGVDISASGSGKTADKTGSGGGSLSANFKKGNSASDTAVVGSMSSGGELNINAGNASFEGTKFASTGDTNISADTVSFMAAKSSSSGSNLGLGANVAVKVPSKTVQTPTTTTPVITPPTPQAAPAGAIPIVKPTPSSTPASTPATTSTTPATTPVKTGPVITPPTPQPAPAGAIPIVRSTTPTSSTPTNAPATTPIAANPPKEPGTAVNGGLNVAVGKSNETTYQGSSFETGTGGQLNINANSILMQNTDTSKVDGNKNYSTGPTIEKLNDSSSGFNFSGGVSNVGTDTLQKLSSAKDKVLDTKNKIANKLGVGDQSNSANTSNGTTNTGGTAPTVPTNPVTTVTTTTGDTTTTTKTANTLDLLKGLFSSQPQTPTPPAVITPPTPQAAPAGAIPIVKPEPRLPIPPVPTTPLRSTGN